MWRNRLVYFAILLFLIACQPEESAVRTYLFLGHPYDWNYPDRIDARLETVDFTQFDQIWLGGDVCSATTQSRETLSYLDSLFKLKEKTYWTWGNHDIKFENEQYLVDATGKPDFYTEYRDDLCIMVLNTNYYWWYDAPPPQRDCEAKQAQWEMIEAVCDTIERSSHLVVLHHHSLLNELKEVRPGAPENAFNINANNIRMTCDSTSDFTKLVYPLLEDVQQRGIQVVLIGGDFGMAAKSYAFQTEEGIWLLGSGINNTVPRKYAPEYVTNFDPDQVLVLTHDLKARKLDWQFLLLEEEFLPKYGKK